MKTKQTKDLLYSWEVMERDKDGRERNESGITLDLQVWRLGDGQLLVRAEDHLKEYGIGSLIPEVDWNGQTTVTPPRPKPELGEPVLYLIPRRKAEEIVALCQKVKSGCHKIFSSWGCRRMNPYDITDRCKHLASHVGTQEVRTKGIEVHRRIGECRAFDISRYTSGTEHWEYEHE